MLDNRQVRNNVVLTSENASVDDVEVFQCFNYGKFCCFRVVMYVSLTCNAMWRLKIQNNQDGVVPQSSPYPDRPNEPNCIFFLRTGTCAYGVNCRFNHPAYVGQAAQLSGELPERVGQPDCQYFLKTGTCRFGATCKYHHPRDRKDVGQVQLNILGLPLRQEEKPCPYYMRNGSCKFGSACKFHHPQPVGSLLPVTAPMAYGSSGSTVGVPPSVYFFPHFHQGTMSSVSSAGLLGSNNIYTSKNELGSSMQAHLSSPTSFPERLDQPECQFYMKTGSCKFGPSCKYNHPKERIAASATCALGPLGLPLRPGQAICTFYSMYGGCRYGANCKFDHPMTAFYNYGMNVPTLTLPAPPSYPYQINMSPETPTFETSPSKSLRLADSSMKPGSTSTKDSEDSSRRALSPANTSPTSVDPSQN
ncbi:hypothetical protein GIB67_033075 [Kingdonia uniflora]|uniref:C3H1-type domain-containing protein n=1 Tax=Kingdonia uniflora TaxID=39325 RepID=A0A7J7MYH7_9MAGN|nr:hypothetical protein GIB67_033075 [Kingdonia uniflora]